MSRAPFVSILMPVRNEAHAIARSLRATLAQDYPRDRFEVLVVDALSTDGTRAIMAEILAAHPEVNARVLDKPAQIVPAALNLGLNAAQGDIIVRVDGHTFIAPDYVRQCVAALERSGADNVGGRMHAVGNGPMSEAIAVATSSPFGVGGARFHYSEDEEWVDTVYMGAWPRSVFERIGPFDETFVRNQDDEFNYRLLDAGGKILLSPAIRSEYSNRSRLGTLWQQYFGYGLYKVLVMRKHPRQVRPRQLAPPLLAGSLLFGAVLAPFFAPARLALIGLIALYAAANLAASWVTAAARTPAPAAAAAGVRRPAPELWLRLPGRAGALRPHPHPRAKTDLTPCPPG